MDRQIRVLAPNSTACFNIPQTDICEVLTFVQAQNQENPGVVCPLFDSTVGSMIFQSCAGRLQANPVPYIATNGIVCLNATVNETTIHFQCTIDPCVIDSCLTNVIIWSHRIIIAGMC